MLLGAKGQSLGNAIEEVIAAKRLANRRESYVAELGRYLRKFAMGRAEMDVAVFSPKVIEKWFAGRSDTAHGRATGINRLSTLFDFCWRKKWIAENPCTRLERVHLEYGIPKLLSVDECERLMHAAERLDATLLPRLSLMLFAGVQRDEVSRLSWNDLDLDAGTLMISAAASKVRHRRIVHLQPACAAWLRKGGDLSGLKNLRRRPEAIRGAADIKAWPHDVLRHTAASHLVPLVGTGKAVEMLGNSESILHRHYRDLVKPQDNARFWSILPAGSKQESRVA